jgi:hypothetical protein
MKGTLNSSRYSLTRSATLQAGVAPCHARRVRKLGRADLQGKSSSPPGAARVKVDAPIERTPSPVRPAAEPTADGPRRLSTAGSATRSGAAAYGEPKAPAEAQAVRLHPRRRRSTPKPSLSSRRPGTQGIDWRQRLPSAFSKRRAPALGTLR